MAFWLIPALVWLGFNEQLFLTIVMPTISVHYWHAYRSYILQWGKVAIYSKSFIHHLADHFPNYLLLVNKREKTNKKEQSPFIRIGPYTQNKISCRDYNV